MSTTPASSGAASTRVPAPSRRVKTWGRVTVSTSASDGTFQESTSGDGMGNLLRSMQSTKLLTTEDEKTLTIRVQNFLKLEQKYEAFKAKCVLEMGVGASPSISDFAASFGSHVNPRVVEDMYEEGKFCKQAMVRVNLRLVISIAKKHTNRGVPLQVLPSSHLATLRSIYCLLCTIPILIVVMPAFVQLWWHRKKLAGADWMIVKHSFQQPVARVYVV